MKSRISFLRALLSVLALEVGILPAFSQSMSQDVETFKIAIPNQDIQELKDRLANTRWPQSVERAGWEYGADLGYMKELINYWQNSFDWKKQEDRLNQFQQYITHIDGQRIHFIYEKGNGTSSTPIVLLHGWPSSFIQMLEIIPILTKPDAEGHSFDVIVPSLPGYGFSDKPKSKGVNVYQMAEVLHQLMTDKLGYQSFMLRGSDIGAGVAKEWAISHPDAVTGVHLSGSNPYVFQTPTNLTQEEKEFTQKAQNFMMAEGAYAMMQSTKPMTLAYGLNDSPAGLAAWIIEKFNTWSDSEGAFETVFSKDEVLTNISIYWFTHSIGSSINVYYESAHVWSPNASKTVQSPTAFLMLGKDIAVAPRSWEERTYHVVRWNEHPSGGHFSEWERPEIIATDIQEFAKSIKQ